MEGSIIITPHIGTNPDGSKYVTGNFDVTFDGKTADGLGYDECLGLISAITMPENRPCLQWLKTPEQIEAWNNKFNKPDVNTSQKK